MHLCPSDRSPSPEDDFLASKRYAWFVFAMTFALMLFDYIDRQIVVSMFPHLKAEWDLSDKQLGALVSVVAVTVALGTQTARGRHPLERRRSRRADAGAGLIRKDALMTCCQVKESLEWIRLPVQRVVDNRARYGSSAMACAADPAKRKPFSAG